MDAPGPTGTGTAGQGVGQIDINVQGNRFGGGGGGNGACAVACPGTGNSRVNAAGQVAPPGFHWNKSTYTRRGGPCSSKPAGLVLKGTELVKNRRKYNTSNGPALVNAIGRAKASEKPAKQALKLLGWRTISKQSSRELKMRKRH